MFKIFVPSLARALLHTPSLKPIKTKAMKRILHPILLSKDVSQHRKQIEIIGFRPFPDAEPPTGFNLEYTGERHLLTIAPTGSGKSTACIVPNLLNYKHPVVVFDPKGELYKVTARRRREMGHRVILLDPFQEVETNRKRDSLNVMEIIGMSEDPFLECQSLAYNLSGKGFSNDPYWDDNARALLSGVIYYVWKYNKEEEKNLQGVISMLMGDDLDYNLAVILDNNKDLPREIRESFISYLSIPSDKTRPCVLSTIQSYLHIYMSKSVLHSLNDTSFRLKDFTNGKPLDIYIVFPQDKLRSHSRLFVQWLILLMRSVATRKHLVRTDTLFIIDEAAVIGPNDYIANFLTICRGYNTRLWLFFQDLQQILNCYKNEHKTIINNCGIIQVFGINAWNAANDLRQIINVYPDTIRKLQDDRQIVISENMEYIGCKKIDYLSDPDFNGLWDPNPFYRYK